MELRKPAFVKGDYVTFTHHEGFLEAEYNTPLEFISKPRAERIVEHRLLVQGNDRTKLLLHFPDHRKFSRAAIKYLRSSDGCIGISKCAIIVDKKAYSPILGRLASFVSRRKHGFPTRVFPSDKRVKAEVWLIVD